MLLKDLFEARDNTQYTLDNYQNMPNFSDASGRRYKLGDTWYVGEVPPSMGKRKFFRLFPPGTPVTILGRTTEAAPLVVVNPKGTRDVYKVFGYYLTHPTYKSNNGPRLKKVLTGKLKCQACHNVFDLEIPGGKHRNHCPECLSSVHIDNKPGDRAAWCGHGTHDNWTPSILEPIGVTVSNGVPSIVSKCEKCDAIKINKIAPDDNSSIVKQLPRLHVTKRGGKNTLGMREQ